MMVDSESLINQYMIKYVNETTDSHSKKKLRDGKIQLTVDDEISSSFGEDELDYVLVLSHMSKHRRKMFIRFYEVYLYRIYNVRSEFHKSDPLDWKLISDFINSNISYKQLMLGCLHFFI